MVMLSFEFGAIAAEETVIHDTTDWGENDLKINRDHETRDTRVARVTCTCTNGVLHLPGCMRVP